MRGHHFTAQHFYTVMYCSHCGGVLWGIGSQGYQCISKFTSCSNQSQVTKCYRYKCTSSKLKKLCLCVSDCEQNCHKNCMDLVKEQCMGKKAKPKRSSIMDKIITRKPSSNNPAASKLKILLHRLLLCQSCNVYR